MSHLTEPNPEFSQRVRFTFPGQAEFAVIDGPRCATCRHFGGKKKRDKGRCWLAWAMGARVSKGFPGEAFGCSRHEEGERVPRSGKSDLQRQIEATLGAS